VQLDVVSGEPRKGELTAAISNSFGFGGHNTALLFTPAN
jgi:3-oxoacyl-[acyl-carrier-protein] synthase II